MAAVEAISLANVGHNLPLSGQALMTIRFFGLDTTPPTSPPPSSPPPSSPPPSSPPPSSPPPSSPPPTGACRITYAVNAWNTGLTTSITITNTGTATINGWSLVFTLPSGQNITSGWNATYTPSGGQVTARNMSYNGIIAPGAAVRDVGFQATHTGNTGRPASFTLNGSGCTIA
jgi:cellulase/cellobiase CelA1